MTLSRLTCMLCALPALGLLICQCVPFWNLDGERLSINGFVWFCLDYPHFELYFKQMLNDATFDAGKIAGVNTLTLLSSSLTIFFCIKNSDDWWSLIFPIISGFVCLYSYMAYPVYRIGALWGLHVAMGIVMLVLAERAILFRLLNKYDNRL